MNVIFLDFDGVIDTYYYRTDEQMESKIKILADICKRYDCKVVIEASAKDAIDEETMEVEEDAIRTKKIFEYFKKYGIECIGRTPRVKKYHSNDKRSYVDIWKEDEIRLYLMRHPEIEHYCVIDDDDLKAMRCKSDLDKVRPHLVTTELYDEDNPKNEGLQSHHEEGVGKVLKLDNEIRNMILRRNARNKNK